MSKRGPDRGGPQGPMKRRSHGKPMIKLLCPYYCAGAIIGKGGETIKELMDRTECDVKISKTDERFPTTSERVVSVQGEAKSVEECILFCQDKIRKDEPPPNAKKESHLSNAKRKECCKLVVSDTSAGRIIGKGGQRIKDLKNDYNVIINISRKDEMPRGFEERCVSVEGEDGNVDNCVQEIVKLVCEDETASMEWHVFYNDWSQRRDSLDDRGDHGFGGRDGGRDFRRDHGPRDNFGGRDSYGDRDGYNRDDGRDSYGGRYSGRDDRDRGMSRDGRDYGRDGGRDSYMGPGARDSGYGGGRDGGDRDYGRDRYSGRDSYGGYGGRDDMRRDPSPIAVRRDPSFGRADSFAIRDAPRDDYGARDGGRGYRDGGYRDGGRSSMPDRRDDFRGGRDIPRGGGRY